MGLKKYIKLTLILMMCMYILGCRNNEFKVSLRNSRWEADGTQHRVIVGLEDGKPIYGDDSPIYLQFDNNDNYTIIRGIIEESGVYIESDDGRMQLKSNQGGYMRTCQFQSQSEMSCNLNGVDYIFTRK